jgi:DNA-binding response OmpR family regulator
MVGVRHQEEFDMLVFLVTHPKTIVTSHTRLARRWGHNQTRQTDFLRVLNDLRKKIESGRGFAHYIRMESWVVYRFDPGNRKEGQ